MTTHIVERAFQIARTGTCRSVNDLRRALRLERYAGIEQTFQGKSIRDELRAVMAAARRGIGQGEIGRGDASAAL